MPTEAIKELITNLNDAWRTGRFDDLAALFHQNAVIIAPNGSVLAQGRDACVQGYREYALLARTQTFEMHEPVVLVHDTTAVAQYHFHIRYERGGETHEESGGEQLVFVHEDGAWRIIWRGVLPAGGHQH